MQNSFAWSPPVAVLAASIILRSHREWPEDLGPRLSTDLARRLSREFACEYLLPNAGRAWIISSSTVREFVSETLEADSKRGPQCINVVADPLRFLLVS